MTARLKQEPASSRNHNRRVFPPHIDIPHRLHGTKLYWPFQAVPCLVNLDTMCRRHWFRSPARFRNHAVLR